MRVLLSIALLLSALDLYLSAVAVNQLQEVAKAAAATAASERAKGFDLGKAYAEDKKIAPPYVARLAEAWCRLDVDALEPYIVDSHGLSREELEEATKNMRAKLNGWICEDVQYFGSIAYSAGHTDYFFKMTVSGTPMRFIARFSADGKLTNIY